MLKPKILIGCIAVIYLFAYLHFGFWRNSLMGGDSWGYYIHLPACFLYHDTGDYSKCDEARKSHNPTGGDPYLGLIPSPTGKKVIKYPLGVAFMEAPFFAVAHGYCLLTGTPTDGYSPPYLFFVGFSTMFYAIWGIWLLLLALRPYIQEEKIRMMVALILALATNLFYASTYTVGMSHPYLFFLYALMLLGIIRFMERPRIKGAIWVGVSAGMITLTRSPEAICVLIPLFWGVNKWSDLSGRFRFFKTHAGKMGIATVAFGIMLLPQAFYWKYVSDQWWYYGYQGEHFDWAHPRILDGLFNYKNGWLIYTPVMAFGLLGIFWLRNRLTDARLPILLFLPVHWYIIYSWWCWNYINGFGSRPMIEVSALLAFPLAALLGAMWTKKWSRTTGAALIIFFIWLNLFQTWQVTRGLMLSESMNRAYYCAIFGKTESDDAAAIAYNSNELQPDMIRTQYQKLFHGRQDTLILVKQLAFNDMEDSTSILFSRAVKKSGSFGFRCDDEFSPGCYLETSDTSKISAGDYLRVSVSTFVKANEMCYEHDKLAMLVVHIFDPAGETLKYAQVAASARTQNTTGSIWFTGVPETWGDASFFVKVPEEFKYPDRIKVYVWNPARQRIYLDALKLELWRYH